MKKKIVVSILVTVLLIASITLSSFAQTDTDAQEPSAYEMLELVNSFRESEGEEALELNDALNRAAKKRAQEMANEAQISHTRPDGTIFDTSFGASGEKGENVFRGGPLDASDVPQKAFDGWKGSLGHRQNMIDCIWGYMGIGYVLGQDGYWYVCQLFTQTKNVTDEGTDAEPSVEPDSEGSEEPDASQEPSSGASASSSPSQSAEPTESSKPDKTPEPTYDPSRILQRLEGPDEAVAGEKVTFRVVAGDSFNLWALKSIVWSTPGRYKSYVSSDQRTLTLQTKTEDDFTVSCTITKRNGQTEKVSKQIHVSNAVPVKLDAPDQVPPCKRAKITLDAPEDASPQDISWSVIPGICALDFSDDKRTCTFVPPNDGPIQFIAKVKLDGSVATAKKTVNVVSEFPVELKVIMPGRVGYELEVYAQMDHSIRPVDIYWNMYPGTCDARFTHDNRTMYFTPTNTETLEITVHAKMDGKIGASKIIVPVAPAVTAQTDKPAESTQTPAVPSEGTALPSAEVSAAPSGTATQTVPAGTASASGTPLPPLPTYAQQTEQASVSPAQTDGAVPSAVPTADLPASPSADGIQQPTSGPNAVSTPSAAGSAEEVPTDSSGAFSEETGVFESETIEGSVLQVSEDVPVSVRDIGGENERAVVAELKSALTIEDILAGVDLPERHEVFVIGQDGKFVNEDARPASGQILQITNGNGIAVESVPIIVPGDVIGSGQMSIQQLVRAAADMTGREELGSIFRKAAKLTGTGSNNLDGKVSISDLVHMASLLLESNKAA